MNIFYFIYLNVIKSDILYLHFSCSVQFTLRQHCQGSRRALPPSSISLVHDPSSSAPLLCIRADFRDNVSEYHMLYKHLKGGRGRGRARGRFGQEQGGRGPTYENYSQSQLSHSVYRSIGLVHNNTSKHIEIQYHFVRDCVISGKIDLKKISTVDNVADGMTKCLSADRFWSLQHQMGVMKNWSN